MKEDINSTEPSEVRKRPTLGLKQFFSMGEVGGYFFRKKDPNRPTNQYLKMMHGINRISITVFLAAVIYLVIKHWL